jgi:hypothetical protein
MEKLGGKSLSEEPLNEEEVLWVRNGEAPTFLLKKPLQPNMRNIIRRVDEVEHSTQIELKGLSGQIQALTALVQEVRDAQMAGM